MRSIRKKDIASMLWDSLAYFEATPFGSGFENQQWFQRGAAPSIDRLEMPDDRRIRFHTEDGVFEIVVRKPRNLNN